MKNITFSIALLISALLFGCATAIPNTNRLPPNVKTASAVSIAAQDISPEDEYYIGRAVAASLIKQYGLYEDQQSVQYINLIGQTLCIASDRPEIYNGYHFAILDTPALNCYSTPGGHVLITKGLLKMGKSEDMIAGVLAQSICQIVLRSGTRSIMEARWAAAAIAIGRNSANESESQNLRGMSQEQLEELRSVMMTSVTAGETKKQTLAADAMAVSLLSKVGYNPSDYLDLLKLWPSEPSNQPNAIETATFMRQRIETVRDEIARLCSVQNAYAGKKERQQRFETIQSRL